MLVHLREGEPELVTQANRVRKKRAEAALAGTMALVNAGPEGAGGTAVTGVAEAGEIGSELPVTAGGAGSTVPRRPVSGSTGGAQRQQPRKGGSGRGRSSGRKR